MANKRTPPVESPKMGRPPLPPGVRKDDYLMLRCSPDEKRWVQDWALRLGYATTADFQWAAMELHVRLGRPQSLTEAIVRLRTKD